MQSQASAQFRTAGQLDQVHHGSRSLPHRERPTDQLPDQDQHPEILPRAGGSLPARSPSPRNPTRALYLTACSSTQLSPPPTFVPYEVTPGDASKVKDVVDNIRARPHSVAPPFA